MKTKKINDIKVKPLKIQKAKPEDICGYEMIPNLYANVFICAHKNSGKSTVIFNILKNCINKDTHVIFFVGTINKDNTYKEMIDYLKKKEIKYTTYQSIFDEDDSKIDLVSLIFNELKNKVSEEEVINNKESDSEEEDKVILVSHEDEIKVSIKKKKPKKMAPEYFFIFDDISADLPSSKGVTSLLKANRHIKSKVIISSQYVNDLSPGARSNVDIWLLFNGHNDDKLKIIYGCSDPVITYEKFVDIYKNATEEKYSFLMIDKDNSKYRKKFDEEYIL